MANLEVDFCGIKSPNPFWLASAPPTNTYGQVARAFDIGWGGAVWKTIGERIVNVSSRYSAVNYQTGKIMGLNNIELITDRTLEENLEELTLLKKNYPNNAVIVSIMVESNPETWADIIKKAEDTGCDGIELNFGCPHGMSERGMGAAVGQVPEYTQKITQWAKDAATVPVLVKLTPNITDVTFAGRAAKEGGADGISLINTINSITGINLDTFVPNPAVDNASSHGGYCGPAVKPIALNMVHEICADPAIQLPVSGIGGIQRWQDAVEFILLGAGTVQVCTAVMHYGYRIVEGMKDGLSNWMDEKGFEKIDDFRGKTLEHVTNWKHLDLNYKVIANINEDKCINCGLCYVACEDGAHQSILKLDGPAGTDENRYEVNRDTCVGCNMCSLVCPVENCITMQKQDTGAEHLSWEEYQEKLKKGEMDPIPAPSH
jgi:dihydropyrimidine dehydrogenase (NAD+) subunit PreA